MRLIDVGELKKQIAGMAIKNHYSVKRANALCKLLDEQPTAFDVDKVVGQLDDEANRSYADFKKYADEIGESESDNWYYIGLRRAIGIVKGGGN